MKLLSIAYASSKTIHEMEERLHEIQHGPRKDAVDWEHFHLYLLLETGKTLSESCNIAEYNEEIEKLGKKFPELVIEE